MESIIRDFIIEHFLTNGFLAMNNMISLREINSFAIIKNTWYWTSQLDASKHIDVIYTDFEKAFDKVPHNAAQDEHRTLSLSPPPKGWLKKTQCPKFEQ